MNSVDSKVPVVYEVQDRVASITLNEPDSMNALSGPLKNAMASAISRAMDDPQVRCLLITGVGRAFCAGGDLRTMDERSSQAVRERMHRSYVWVRQLLCGDKPVIGAVNGVAAGAGLSLALLCDVLVASSRATFTPGFSVIGAAPDLALAYTLPRAVGIALAKDMFLTNRRLSAQEALAFGLVSRVVEPEGLQEASRALALQVAQGPLSLSLAKGLLNRAFDGGAEAFLEREALSQAAAFNSQDFEEGVRAFLDKRAPQFRGA